MFEELSTDAVITSTKIQGIVYSALEYARSWHKEWMLFADHSIVIFDEDREQALHISNEFEDGMLATAVFKKLEKKNGGYQVVRVEEIPFEEIEDDFNEVVSKAVYWL